MHKISIRYNTKYFPVWCVQNGAAVLGASVCIGSPRIHYVKMQYFGVEYSGWRQDGRSMVEERRNKGSCGK